MHTHINDGPDVFLFGIPLVALLFFGYFRLDETFTLRKRVPAPLPGPAPVVDKDGEPVGTDPDGRPWEKGSGRRRTA
ncbi:hypothetical protein DYQ86_23715 [Acidobacteria bacterium AB60]|nr:hypothetical protein DYQ86_23715 [Acidobacteria bacterium AB60]